MLESSFETLYLKFRANYYRKMVETIGTREGSLSATESYCTEIIHLLGRPTITEFADFLNISVPNANYKISCLVNKGYVLKSTSARDRREQILSVTEKFTRYYGLNDENNESLMLEIRRHFSAEDVEALDATIQKIILILDTIEKSKESK